MSDDKYYPKVFKIRFTSASQYRSEICTYIDRQGNITGALSYPLYSRYHLKDYGIYQLYDKNLGKILKDEGFSRKVIDYLCHETFIKLDDQSFGINMTDGSQTGSFFYGPLYIEHCLITQAFETGGEYSDLDVKVWITENKPSIEWAELDHLHEKPYNKTRPAFCIDQVERSIEL